MAYIPVADKPTLESLNDTLLAISDFVGSFTQVVPVGMILEWAGESDPIGDKYLICDGRELNIADYPELYAAIGTKYGSGTKASTFNLPDRRGVFGRGDAIINTIAGSGAVASNNATFTAHGLNRTGFKVRLTAGTLTGLILSTTTYYAIVVDANTLALASTYANALSGTKIAISGTNSGTLTQWESPDADTRLKTTANGPITGVGTREEDAMQLLTGGITRVQGYNTLSVSGVISKSSSTNQGGAQGDTVQEADLLFDNSLTTPIADENRPANLAVNYIIRLI